MAAGSAVLHDMRCAASDASHYQSICCVRLYIPMHIIDTDSVGMGFVFEMHELTYEALQIPRMTSKACN